MTTPLNTPNSSSRPSRHLSSDLLAFSKAHVHYDVNMFFEMASVQSRLNHNNDFLHALATINDGLSEAFALHLRNLIMFFYNDAPAPLEVVAADFCAEGSWVEVRQSMTRTLSIAHKRAVKTLLLLTFERESHGAPEKAWDFDGLAAEIKLILLIFVKTALPERLASNVALATL